MLRCDLICESESASERYTKFVCVPACALLTLKFGVKNIVDRLPPADTIGANSEIRVDKMDSKHMRFRFI